MWRDRLATLVALALALASSSTMAASPKALRQLVAPEPASIVPFSPDAKPRAIKFARIAIQLNPEPWAIMTIYEHREGNRLVPTSEDLLTWQEGQVDLKPTIVSGIVAEELRAAGGETDEGAQSLFAQEGAADLLLGARVTEMTGRFCQFCDKLFFAGTDWVGAVVMSTRWEVYSNLDRRVVATIETTGGFTTPKTGLPGDPQRLIYEAFRDNLRRLIAHPDFRRAVTGSVAPPASTEVTSASIKLAAAAPRRSIAEAARSTVTVFSGGGAGSGFLVSTEGYVVTNHHVVGGSKYVKVKWSDGSETLGEVIRSDRRRDVALIKVDAARRAALALRTTAPALGEAVYAIGTPLDEKFQGSVTKGIVSATRTYDGLPFIQSDAVINSGNSGGPLLDENGAVIGVCVSGVDINGAPAGINLFIPIDDALKALALTPAG